MGSLVREDAESENESFSKLTGINISQTRLKQGVTDSYIQFITNFVEQNKITSTDQLSAYGQWLNQMLNKINLQSAAIQFILLENEAKRFGFVTSSQEVKQWLQYFPLFQIGGQFNFVTYENLVKNLFRSWPAQFEKSITRILTVRKLENFIMDSVLVSNTETFQAYKEKNEKAIVYYIRIDDSFFLSKVTEITPEELDKYYQQHREEFQEPEKIKVTYLVFDPALLKKEIDIGPKEVEDYYQDNKDNFKKEDDNLKKLEEVREEIILELKNDKAAAQAYDLALDASINLTEKRRGDLVTLAKENAWTVADSNFVAKTEFIPELGWAPQLMTTVWDMETDTISEPLRISNKWVIVSPQAKQPQHIPELATITDKVKAKVKKEKAAALAKKEALELNTKLKDLMQNKTPFTIAAKSLGLKVVKIKPFTIKGTIPKIGKADDLAKTAFTMPPQSIAGPIAIPGGYAILSLRRIQPIDQAKWEKEKNQFKQSYLEEKKRRVLKEWETQLLRKAS